MSGTRVGGLKARDKNLQIDPNFYANIGSIGGQNSSDGGFNHFKNTPCYCEIMEAPHRKPQCAGKKGGTISKRVSKKNA